jgi:hypothetical protein
LVLKGRSQEYDFGAILDLRYDEARNYGGECRTRDARHAVRFWRLGMLSRALGLATVMLLTSSLAAERALAQAQNLEAGKSPSQIFAGTCTACHKSPRGLLKTVAAGSLPGFLRQHYTTSGDMAGVLASYLISNGANDTRYAVTQQKGAKDGTKDGTKDATRDGTKDGVKEGTREAAREARSDTHSATQPDPTERFGHRPRSAALPPVEGADPHDPHHPSRADVDTQAPQTTTERGPDGHRLSAKQRLSRRGKPGDELPKVDTAREAPAMGELPKSEAVRGEPGKSDADRSGGDGRPESARTEPAKPEPAKPEPAKSEPAKPEPAKPESAKSESAKSEAAKSEAARETGGETSALRADPVPPVTPAPSSGSSSSVSAAAGSSGDSAAMSYAAPAPVLTISASSPPPVPPAGPPAPPISK